MDNYKFGDDCWTEQYNTLLLLDKIMENKSYKEKVKLYICGGTALLFHNILDIVTIDIDVCVRLDREVLDDVEPFVNDMAAGVVVLTMNWKKRAIRYKEEDFKNFEVYLMSLEDLIISKLAAWRYKDKEDLKCVDKLCHIRIHDVCKLIDTEIGSDMRSELHSRLELI